MGPYPGGPGGIRTLDLFSAIEALSQLSHRPTDVGAFYPTCEGTVKLRFNRSPFHRFAGVWHTVCNRASLEEFCGIVEPWRPTTCLP